MELLAACAILIVATALRLRGLSSELWYDEVITYVRYAHRPIAEIVTSYDSQNQHLLYSVLARLSVAIGGDGPAALRAPAVAFGVASLAALHALGRKIVSERESLFAAALLSVSYHHVWFSQNARGYTALLFFTLLSTLFVLRALAEDRTRSWTAYAITAALGAYAHLTMLLVVAGHLLVVVEQRIRGAASGRAVSWRGPVLGFGVLAALVFAAYAPVFARVAQVAATEGRDASASIAWNSPGWAASEMAMALRAGFAGGATPLVALALAAAGALRLARERPIALALFVLPVVVTVTVLLVSAHTLWPRYLFFAIGFAALVVVAGAFAVGTAFARLVRLPRAAGPVGSALALALVATATVSLPRAYAPKQRFAEAVALIERERARGDAVVVLGRARDVFEDYYRTGWSTAASADELRARSAAGGRTWAVYAFPIEQASCYPDVQRLLQSDFEPVAQLAGTLHGGDVVIWRSTAGSGGRSE